jgi:tetratricopeptide (TPR) repeat protein
MQCSRCQARNRDGLNFCEDCGARLAPACPQCGAEVTAGKWFCGACGAQVATVAIDPVERFAAPGSYTPMHLAERILTSRAALEGERKHVTVLFADLKGSLELLADRDPEEARTLLDPVLERMMEAVHRYEGTVNQVMGDGIMALFGAPLAHEDHAVRACYAALRMQQSVRAYADAVFRSHGVPLQIRIGLNSGEVVVRAIGSDLRMDESGARPGDLIVALGALGAVHLARGDHREAVPILERGLALCRSWGILDWSPTLATALATAYAREGRFQEAFALHQRAAEEEAHGTQGTPTTGFLRLGETYLLAHRLDDARACAEQALGVARTAGERSSEARALRLLGEVEAAGDPPDAGRAARHLREALARSEALGLRPLAAHCHLGLGRLYRRTGDPGKADEHLTAATALYREMDMGTGLTEAEAALGPPPRRSP